MSIATPPSSLYERLQHFAPQRVDTAGGPIGYRQSGCDEITHVLLHGIGSASGSWLMQLEAALGSARYGVLAWDAPGYAGSSPVAPQQPSASDYSARLWSWLDAMHVSHPVTLVGHSLGALMAARAAAECPAHVSRMVLLAPAQGYAKATAVERDKKLNDRLTQLAQLGPYGLAAKRGAGMVSPQAPPELAAYTQQMMSLINVNGYTQAAHLLAGGDLLADLANVQCPVAVASGQLDTATPMADCQAVAAAAKTPWLDLGPVGHACALEAAPQVNDILKISPPKQKPAP